MDHKKLKSNQANEEIANDREPPIFKLNDDCVRYIFSFLHMKQRIQIQRVCKRWQRISKLPWNDVKKLDAIKKFGFDPDPMKIEYNLPILKQILSLCGSSLTHIKLPDIQTKTSDLMILIKKMCPSLRSIDFMRVVITRKTAKYIAENFTQLTDIVIFRCWNDCEDSLAQFFANNRRLKSIHIHDSKRITGSCLLGLPESLNEIYIMEGDNIQAEHFCNTLQKLVNLRSLELRYSLKLLHKFDLFIDALPNKQSLEELTLSYPSSSRADKLIHIKNIVQLTNLRKLVLSGSLLLHDEILINIGTYCTNLKIVHLDDSNRVTNRSWQSFTATLNLEELELKRLTQLPGKYFASMDMPSLKLLKCDGCFRFNSKTFKVLVQKLDNLERLDVFGCGDAHGDAEKLIKDVLVALKTRKNEKTLELHIRNETNIREVREISSSLILVKEKRDWWA